MIQICSSCSAENTAAARYCTRCGAPLEGAERRPPEEAVPEAVRAVPPSGEAGPSPEEGDRFKTIVAILIAVVSLVGALLAWRISVASSTAADADVQGVVSTIAHNQALAASEAEMYRNLLVYLQVRIHDLWSLTLFEEYEQYPSRDPTRDRLWDEAWTEIRVAEAYLDLVDIRPEYILPDGSYDGEAAQSIDMAHRALSADFDPQGRHFARSDDMRQRVQWLMGLTLILSLVLPCYTLAEVIRGRLRYLFFGLGSLLFILVVIGLPFVEGWIG